MAHSDPQLISSLKSSALVMSVVIFLIGVMVLFGWIFDITLFKSLLPNFIPMNPGTALCFILIGISLLLQRFSAHRLILLSGKILGIIVCLFGLITLIEFILKIDFRIISFLVVDSPADLPLQGKPAPFRTFNFILIGLALFLLEARSTVYLNQILAFIIGLLGLLILTGYIFSFHSEIFIQTYSHSSIYTAFCFIMTSLCLLCSHPGRGIMSLFVSKTNGGVVARRLIPLVIIIPILLGYFRIVGQHYNFYAPNSGIEFYSTCIIATFIIVTLLISSMLMKADLSQMDIETKLRVSNDALNDLYNNAPCGYYSVDKHGTILRMNQTALNWLGYTAQEIAGNMKISDLLTPAAKLGFDHRLDTIITRGYIHDTEISMVRKNGCIFTVLLNATAINDDHGNFLMTRSTIVDISERKRIEQELRISEERFHSAMDTAPIGMAIISLEGQYVEVNQALCHLLGYEKNELLQLKFQQITHPDDTDIDVANMKKLIEGKINLNQIEKRYIRKNGEIIWVQLTASILRDTISKEPLYFIAQVEDVTDRKLTEERIRHLAYHDSLTNLPNRRLLLDRLSIAMDFAKRHQNLMALMFLDLDKFKDINDTLGHDVGDELLKAVAVRLNTALRSVDTIARISGDEFVIILNEIPSAHEAGMIATKIIEIMNNRFLIHGHEIHVGCSIGITLYPTDSLEISDLMKKADLAMYAAKESGRNQYRFYH